MMTYTHASNSTSFIHQVRTMKISPLAHATRNTATWAGLISSALIWLALLAAPCGGAELHIRELRKIELPINAQTIAWHPDSRTIAAGGFSGMLTVWDAESGRLIQDLKQTNGIVDSLEFSHDGKFLAVGKGAVRRGAYLTVFDAATYRVMEERESPNVLNGRVSPGMRSLSIDPKTQKKIAVPGYEQGWDPVIFLIGRDSRERIVIPSKPRYSVQRLAFSPAKDVLAVGRINSLVDFYSSEDGRMLKSFEAHDDWILKALVFSPGGKFLYTGSDTGTRHGYLDKATSQWRERSNNEPIKMWDVETLRLVRTFDSEGMAVWSLALSPDGRYLYAGLAKRLTVWEVSTGAKVKQLNISSGGLIVMVSANGKRLATTDIDTRLMRIWSVSY